MKKIISLMVLGCLVFLGTSCTHEQEINRMEDVSEAAASEFAAKAPDDCTAETVPYELVVQYQRRSIFDKVKIRDRYKVPRIKKCECADETLELWIFDVKDAEGNPIDIEEKKQIAETDPDLEGVHHNFLLSTTGTLPDYSGRIPFSTAMDTHLISGEQNGVDIAVLDTGLQFNYSGFETPFLYHSLGNGSACIDDGKVELSGWDFRDQDPIADDQNGHGTIVTQIIYETLEHLDVDYRILPVKIFDKNGQGSYFDLLCGYRFAVNKPGIDMVNMSFGWCGKPHTLLQQFIAETEQEGKILIITSAGNMGLSNDQMGHYPSSYPNANVLSIAAMNEGLIGLAPFSNYGKNTVDFGTPGTHVLSDFGSVSGTSFAAAAATANAAFFLDQGVAINNIEAHMDAASIPLKSLHEIKYASYLSN